MKAIYPIFPLPVVFLFLFLGKNTPLFAQDYLADIQHYNIKEGLSHREVFSIHQDKEGFIWLGTKYGLDRFDGKSFKTWTKEKQGLVTNEIHHILEDGEGWLWVFTGTNWFHLDYPTHCSLVHAHSGEVQTLEERFGAKLPFQLEEVCHIMADETNRLFFSTKANQLFSYFPNEGFRLVPTDFENLFFPTLRRIGETGQDTIWGYTGQTAPLKVSLTAIDGKGKLLYRKPLGEGVEFLRFFRQAQDVNYVTFHPKQEPKLYTVNSKGETLSHNYLDLSTEIRKGWEVGDWSRQFFYQPKQDLYWFKSHPHFFVFHLDKGVVYNFEEAHRELIDADIHTVFFDKDGFAWVGTAYGLYKIELKNNPFGRLLYQNYDDYQISDAYSCRGLWVDNEQTWINTYRGRRYFETLGATPQILPHISNPFTDAKKLFLLWNPLAIYQDRFEQVMWFGESSLVKRDLKSGAEQPYFWKESIDFSPQIWNIFQDEGGQVWVGTQQGIGLLDTVQNILRYDDNLQKEMAEGFVHAFVEHSKDSVWVCTSTGLYLWTPRKGILKRFWTGGTGNAYVPHDNILHLREDEVGVLWLASGGGGLIQLPPQSTTDNGQPKTLTQFTTEDGLSNNNLYAIYEDDFNNLWMSSDYGIIRFNKKTHRAKAFLPSDGISHHEFNRTSHFQDEKGRIYFGGLNGVTVFDPKNLQEESVLETPIKITNFQQMDGGMNELLNKTNDLLKSQKIVLQPKDGFFRLQFALLDYRNPELVRFAWKIEGLDKNWHHIKENFIRVIGLPYGDYLLKIKGQAATGEWSQNELHLPITVLSPFYLKTWFLICLAILMLLMVVFGYNWRTNQLKIRQIRLQNLIKERTKTIEQQTEELRTLDRLKSRFFANVSHELRTPLTLILGPISTALEQHKRENRDSTLLSLARQNAQQLLLLVNSILDFSKLESGKLKLEETSIVLWSLMNRLLGQYESNAQFQGIELKFEFEADPYLQIELDVSKFETIFDNLLSNALKFTPKGGKINVKILDFPNQLGLQVTDTGRGIHPEDLPYIFDRFYQAKKENAPIEGGTGIGLALCQEYAALFNGKLRVESEWGKGSTFYFIFPKKEVMEATSFELPVDQATAEGQKPKTENQQLTTDHSQLTTILLVEDNEDLRAYLYTILQEQYHVITAENGQVALEVLSSEDKGNSESRILPPKLIISDIMMPIMDGFQLLEKLKSDAQFKQIPVIMLTARADIQDKLRALQIGVDDYLIKPFEEVELTARIDNLLRNYEERQWATSSLSSLDLPSESNDGQASEKTIIPTPEWLKALDKILEKQLDNIAFSVDDLPAQLAMSRRSFFRQMKEHTGLTPNQYLREFRLQKARQLLETQTAPTIKEIAYAVGFLKVSYFSELFKKRFGKTPSDYLSAR